MLKKTQCMWIASSQKLKLAPKLNLYIGTQKLQDVNCYKYLGVQSDSELTLSSFVREIHSKIANTIFMLSKLRYMVDESTAITIYNQTILPFADYCRFFIDSSAKKPSLIKFKCYRIRTLEFGYVVRWGIKQLMDCIKGVRFQYCLIEEKNRYLLLSKKVVRAPSYINTRKADKFNFVLKRLRSDFYIKSPYYRGVKIWESLDNDVQFQVTKESFKRLVKIKFGTMMKGKRHKKRIVIL